jgi:uncharacterized protein YifE (UPF0438 family)
VQKLIKINQTQALFIPVAFQSQHGLYAKADVMTTERYDQLYEVKSALRRPDSTTKSRMLHFRRRAEEAGLAIAKRFLSYITRTKVRR